MVLILINRTEKFMHLFTIFYTGNYFHTSGNIDSPGMGDSQRIPYIPCMKSASQNYFAMFQAGQNKRPVKGHSRSTVTSLDRGIQKIIIRPVFR